MLRRTQEKDKGGWRCCGIKGGAATGWGRRGRGVLEEERPDLVEESRVSRGLGVGKDSRLERTFLPQLILLTG